MNTFEEVLDALDWALKIEVPGVNDEWFYATDQRNIGMEIQYSWAGHEDLPMGLDLSEVA